MKQFFLNLLIFSATAGCIGDVYGANHPHVDQCEAQPEKIYLKPRDVNIFDNQILVHLNGQWVSVPELHADATGIYLNKVGLWFCKFCHWHNGDVPNCAQCGRPRPE